MRATAVLGAACVAVVCYGMASPVHADDELNPVIVDVPVGTAGIGAGLRRTRSPYGGRIDERDLVPVYFYDGRRFFIHGTSLGGHLLSRGDFEIDILARYRFWRIEPDRDPFFAGLRTRRQSVDGGLALRWNRDWGEVGVEWLADLLGHHEGQELEASFRYVFDHRRWSFSPFVRLEWIDADLTDYYFGVSPAEARPGRPAYSPGAARNLGPCKPRARLRDFRRDCLGQLFVRGISKVHLHQHAARPPLKMCHAARPRRIGIF